MATGCGTACQSLPTAGAKPAESGHSQVYYFFSHLFDTADWPPRWHCGNWSDFHGWLYIISDLLIWAAYFAIPILIYIIFKKRKGLPFQKIFLLFCTFIVLCGTTHLIDAVIFWWPIYRFSALVRFLTGIVSVFTVFALYKIMPIILSLRTVDELEREIKERKVVEEKLAASEFLLSESGKMGRVGGFEVDVKSSKINWSQAVYEIYQLPYDYDINVTDTLEVFPQPYGGLLEDAHKTLLNDGTPWDLELELIDAKGCRKWVRCYGEPLFNEDGEIIKIRGVLIDIERYKNSELSLNKSLELLTTQNQQLKSFTHILSHNIRNHASNISMLTGFINPDLLDRGNAEVFHNISLVSAGLNHTLDDLSEAIKIRESALAPETLNFNKVTQSVLDILHTDILVNNAVVDIDFEVEEVKFPAIYLQSIIMNLISNSIKYKKTTEAPTICLRTYIDENGCKVLECIDNGIGINLDLHGNKVFGLYKTFHNRKNAHGVGLFLIKNQVESQGGHIEVFSQTDLGTTFKITFNE